jgi:phosphatidate cytidylyltransferase
MIVHEFEAMLRQAGHRPLPGFGYVVLLTFMGAVVFQLWDRWAAALLTGAVFIPLLLIMFRKDHGGALTDWALTVVSALYVALPAVHFILLRDLHGLLNPFINQIDATGGWQVPLGLPTAVGLGWYLLAQLVTWLTDVGAYIFGRRWGRRKLAPLISPGKSVEGMIGGLILGGLTALFCDLAFGLPISPPFAVLIGLGLSALGQLGDLAESLIKRQAGVKDSSTFIPGHGGVFDRLDSLLVVATATYYLARALN